MLKYLKLKDVGPAPELDISFAPRLNIITGDNGLGKSFLLDVAWWALARNWAREPALPHSHPTTPEISFTYSGKAKPVSQSCKFDRQSEKWTNQRGRPGIPGLVIYAQVDGGFSVWDPARNYSEAEATARPAAFNFTNAEIWEGNALCEGLIRDWASWQRENNVAFTELKQVLKKLSPSPGSPIEIGDLKKISVDDPKRYPTIRMPYAQEVPVVFASAGMRRIMALAYLLVWAWQEHLAASELRGQSPAAQIVLIVDEIEAHLHPQWQRRIVPSMVDVVASLTGDARVEVQLIAATHSPLVLASIEPIYDPERDAWFDLDLQQETQSVTLQRRPFERLGDASNWLTSSAFDLKEARSVEAEEAISAALTITRSRNLEPAEMERVNRLLKASLGELDRFWLRWSAFYDGNRAEK